MSKVILFAAMLAVAAAQQTRVESAESSGAEAARPNSDKVPDGYAVTTQFQKVVILRFKYDTDLLAGMQQMMKENRIKNGVILSGAGSVRGYQIHQVSNRTLPAKIMTEKDPTAPADIISMNGYVIGGKVHAHMTMATADKAFGGHLHADTKVFTFAIITIGVLPDDLDLSKLDDTNYR